MHFNLIAACVVRDGVVSDDKLAVIDKIMGYVRDDDVRNLRRLLGRHKDDLNTLCNRPSRTGWSAVTSAADFGHPDVLK